jgi:excisionase family DNA binding protein
MSSFRLIKVAAFRPYELRRIRPQSAPGQASQALADGRAAYSIYEASRALGISEKSVRQLIAEGKLKAARAGSRIIIGTESIRVFLAGK